MRITKRQLRRIIREEKVRLIQEQGGTDLDFEKKTKAAMQDIKLGRVPHAVNDGDYDYEHIAQALRMKAEEMDEHAKAAATGDPGGYFADRMKKGL